LGGVSTAAVLSASGVALAQKKYDEGASDTEIKLGHCCPYSGPASAYGVIGKLHQAFWKAVNDAGGINGRKVNFITLDDGYSPPKTVEVVRQLVEQEKVLVLYQTLGTDQHRDTQVRQPEEDSAPLHLDRCVEMGRSQALPMDDGLPARLPHRRRDLRQTHAVDLKGRQGRNPDAERRLR